MIRSSRSRPHRSLILRFGSRDHKGSGIAVTSHVSASAATDSCPAAPFGERVPSACASLVPDLGQHRRTKLGSALSPCFVTGGGSATTKSDASRADAAPARRPQSVNLVIVKLSAGLGCGAHRPIADHGETSGSALILIPPLLELRANRATDDEPTHHLRT